MKLSVVILNWNDYAETLSGIKAIRSAYLPHNIDLSIVVVDNASSNQSVEILSKLKGITLIKNPTNAGYTGGNNTGIEYSLKAGADYIWILNPDTEISRSAIAELVKSSIGHKSSIISPKIYFAKGNEFYKKKYTSGDLGKVLWYAGGEIDWSNSQGRHLGVDEVDKGQFEQEREISFATGASLFASSSVFRALKGFDDKYYLYLEDADFSVRAAKNNIKIWFCPKVVLWHKNAKSSKVGGALQDYFFSRNRMLFGLTHGNWRLKFALLRESIRLLVAGRYWQKRGIIDFYLNKFGRGSFASGNKT